MFRVNAPHYIGCDVTPRHLKRNNIVVLELFVTHVYHLPLLVFSSVRHFCIYLFVNDVISLRVVICR